VAISFEKLGWISEFGGLSEFNVLNLSSTSCTKLEVDKAVVD
jgi:hypothetical protein